MNKPFIVKSVLALTGTGVVAGGVILASSYSQKNKKIDDIPTQEFLEKRKAHRVSSLKGVFLKYEQTDDKDAIASIVHGSKVPAHTIFHIENGNFILPDDVNTSLTYGCGSESDDSLHLEKYPDLNKEKICNLKQG